MVIMVNTTNASFKIEQGDCIAQILIIRNEEHEFQEVVELTNTHRGHQGFGSTGKQEAAHAVLTRIEHEEYPDKHCYKVNPELLPEQDRKVKALMKEYEDIIAISYADLPHETVYEHDIDTGDSKPLRAVPYKIVPALENWLRNHLQELLKEGIIVKSRSPWASPVTIVAKKEGTPRMVVDYRKLNAVTKKNAYLIPNIENL